MQDVLRYRRYAAECLRLAHEAPAWDGKARLVLLEMAQGWLKLAKEREQKITAEAKAAQKV